MQWSDVAPINNFLWNKNLYEKNLANITIETDACFKTRWTGTTYRQNVWSGNLNESVHVYIYTAGSLTDRK